MRRSLLYIVTALLATGWTSPAWAQQVIDQHDRQFSQGEVTLHPGEQLTLNNSDQVTHDISVRDPSGQRMSSQMEKPGDHITLTFDHQGEYHVECLIHPKMKMTVRVQ